jgi:hypothetical protein
MAPALPSTNLGLAFKYIKDMQKEYKEKETEEKIQIMHEHEQATTHRNF